MKQLKIYIFLFGLASFYACEKEIDISIPDRERKIVINSLFTANEPLSVNLTKSLSILDRADIVYLNDATVDLYTNNQFMEHLIFQSDGNYSGNILLQPAIDYKIVVNRNGNIATANNSIPNPVNIISIDTGSIRLFDYDYLQCLIEFEDPAEEVNYYMLSANEKHTDIYEYYDYDLDSLFVDTMEFSSSFFESDDIIIENWIYINENSYALFTDNLIDGKSYSINIRFERGSNGYYDSGVDSSKIVFSLFSVSEAYFRYFKTFALHRESYENPFAEPVQVFTNIENGLGVFAGFSSDSDSIQYFSKPFETK